MKLQSVCAIAIGVLVTGIGYRTVGQALPAPTQDRVGFPANYRTTFVKLLTVDRPDNGQIRVIWGNAVAAATPWWENYPHGSVLLFESYTSQRNSNNELVYDASGRLIPVALATIFVKRKEAGFGADYRDLRNGEWEYIAYRPDGTTQTAPSATGGCANCHLQAGGPRDWTFRRQSFAGAGSGAAPTSALAQYSFVPRDLTVKAGATVTWVNADDIEHTILAPGGGYSGVLGYGQTYSQKFEQPGEYQIRCTIHPGMNATVKVTE
jgi:plastocyanin